MSVVPFNPRLPRRPPWTSRRSSTPSSKRPPRSTTPPLDYSWLTLGNKLQILALLLPTAGKALEAVVDGMLSELIAEMSDEDRAQLGMIFPELRHGERP